MYPGGKNGMGVYQTIINHMPPHRKYVEAFLGSGAVYRNKRPAERSILIDRSREALDLCAQHAGEDPKAEYIEGNALAILAGGPFGPETLIYLDPPYLHETRAKTKMYEHELADHEHEELLRVISRSPAMVMISGYRSPMYERALETWTAVDFQAMTRGGMRTETLWINFPIPDRLHDYNHLGSDFREREKLKRRSRRFKAKLDRLPRLERLAMIAAVEDYAAEKG